MIFWLSIAVVLCVALLFWRVVAAGKAALPVVGQLLPEFSLPDQYGAVRTAAEFHGRWLVLYFYPRDNTPGCTRQATCFRDDMQEFVAAGAVVCGISVDNSEKHAAFAREYKLPYALLADGEGALARRCGSLLNLGFIRFARRNTFLVDPQGRIAKVYVGVNPARNAREVLADLKELNR